jgi:hypothetical protein
MSMRDRRGRSSCFVLPLRASCRHADRTPPRADDEAVRILANAIRQSGGRPLTRDADLYRATVVAECLFDRLSLAGVIFMVPGE